MATGRRDDEEANAGPRPKAVGRTQQGWASDEIARLRAVLLADCRRKHQALAASNEDLVNDVLIKMVVERPRAVVRDPQTLARRILTTTASDLSRSTRRAAAREANWTLEWANELGMPVGDGERPAAPPRTYPSADAILARVQLPAAYANAVAADWRAAAVQLAQAEQVLRVVDEAEEGWRRIDGARRALAALADLAPSQRPVAEELERIVEALAPRMARLATLRVPAQWPRSAARSGRPGRKGRDLDVPTRDALLQLRARATAWRRALGQPPPEGGRRGADAKAMDRRIAYLERHAGDVLAALLFTGGACDGLEWPQVLPPLPRRPRGARAHDQIGLLATFHGLPRGAPLAG